MAYDKRKRIEDDTAIPDPGRKQAREDKEAEAMYEKHPEVIRLLTEAQRADHDMREHAREAHLFVDKRNGQWEPYWWNSNKDKPRYSFDMTSPLIDQVASEIEQADFDVRIKPAGGDATKDIALTYDGIVRNIETMSDAKDIYAESGRNMITAGLDGWRVVHKYVDDDTFHQDLAIEKIGNYIDRVWHDPSAELRDKSDSRYCFVLHPVSTYEYEYRWPNGGRASVPDDREGEAYYDKAEVIMVGEILYQKVELRELVLMSNGQVHEVNDDFEKVRDELAAIGVTEARRRTRKVSTICSRFFDADGWLDDKPSRTVFSRVPVIPTYGNYKITENKTVYHGVVEKLLDPQRVMNYSLSREIEEGALAPRAKYWMTMKQAAGHDTTLSTLNTNADPVQFYNADEEAPGPPQQNGGAQVNPGLRTISESMRQIIGQSAGLFAANQGDNPGLQSGIAIEQLQRKGDNGTIKYFKAMEKAIAATGRVLVDAIPRVYDTQRTVRILKEDESYEMVPINQTVIDQETGDVVTVNDLSQGTYDVTCSAGPSFQNRQQETIESMIEMAKVDPSIMQTGGDLLLNNINTPAGKQLAERKRYQMVLQGLIPESQLSDEEKQMLQQRAQQEGQQEDPNMVLAKAEAMKAQAEMLDAQTKQAQAQRDLIKLQLESQKIYLEFQAKNGQISVDQFEAETDRINTQIKAAEASVRIDHEQVQTIGDNLENARKIKDLAMQGMNAPQTGDTRQ